MRAIAVGLTALALAGCGGRGAPKTDADAVTQVLKDAAKAAADGDGDKACSYLTPDAQSQAVLETASGTLGDTSCAQAVKRAQLVLTPLDKTRIKSLEPSNVRVNGTSASATMASGSGADQSQVISVQLNLQKVGSDWKISGFVNQQGLPGG
ncbi:MAG: hypothetical protein ACJ76Z_10225 [Thermoleophilaceae bacterium]